MNFFSFISVLVVTIALSAGQIMFKKAAMMLDADSDSARVVAELVSNKWLLSALAVYFVATILWVSLLRSTPLSMAYPITSLSFLIVPVASHFIFDEPYKLPVLIGGILICVGIGVMGIEIK